MDGPRGRGGEMKRMVWTKVRDFDVSAYHNKRSEQLAVQMRKLRELHDMLMRNCPDIQASIDVYGLSGQVEITIHDAPVNLPHELVANEGITLTKRFDSHRGEFDYVYKSDTGKIQFSSLPPNCELTAVKKYIPAHTRTTYKVKCDGEEAPEESD